MNTPKKFNGHLPDVLNAIQENIKVIDPQRRIVYANTVAAEQAGVEADSIVGKLCHEVFWHRDEPCSWCNTDKVFSTGEAHNCRVIRKEEIVNLTEIFSYPLKDADGHVSYVMEIVREDLGYAAESRNAAPLKDIISRSDCMVKVFETIVRVAPTNAPVLIQGETGTGKELVARVIQELSNRKNKPFIIVNCGAIVETLLESELFGHEKGAFTGATGRVIGRFEQADGGTLFLDEVGELSASMQTKFLRVLQDGIIERVGGREKIKVDVRVIAATNAGIQKAIIEKRFRQDLYFRLNVIPILLPPLRERPGDVPLLVKHFIDLYGGKHGRKVTGINQKAMRALMGYPWPGNVRELENVIERVTILAKSKTIFIADLPAEITGVFPASSKADITFEKNMDQAELAYLKGILTRYLGHSAMAARNAGIGERTLRRLMRKHDLDLKDFRQ